MFVSREKRFLSIYFLYSDFIVIFIGKGRKRQIVNFQFVSFLQKDFALYCVIFKSMYFIADFFQSLFSEISAIFFIEEFLYSHI